MQNKIWCFNYKCEISISISIIYFSNGLYIKTLVFLIDLLKIMSSKLKM